MLRVGRQNSRLQECLNNQASIFLEIWSLDQAVALLKEIGADLPRASGCRETGQESGESSRPVGTGDGAAIGSSRQSRGSIPVGCGSRVNRAGCANQADARGASVGIEMTHGPRKAR